MSQSMKCAPSAVLRIQDDFVAYAFDSAVIRWGVAFEAALQEAASSAKDAKKAESAQQRVIRRWIPAARQYADPRQRR